MVNLPISGKAFSHGLLDVLIRAGMIAVLAVFCFQIFHPFLDLMLWSVILAITLYPLQTWLKHRLGNKEGRTATLIVLVAIAVLMVPVSLLCMSIMESAQSATAMIRSGKVHVPPPPAWLDHWPAIREQVMGVWMQATNDLTGLAEKYAPQIKDFSLTVLGKAAGVGVGFLVFLAALIIAGIVMAYGENGRRASVQIASRIFGPDRGPKITTLCTATIRAVAQGVVGIAFIQMLLVGLGFMLMGVPGAGLLALAVLLLGIMQIPATLITIPVIIFVFAKTGINVATTVFAIYVFVAGLADNVLKPLLLGRGVEVPMPVVLIGALGGMIANGIVGLFIGPVLLAVGYQLFWQWVGETVLGTAVPTDPPQA